MTTFVISGPTGSGKTDFAVRLRASLQVPLVNTDSFQFYKELPIIGNQSSDSEMEWVGFRSLKEPLTSGDFSRMTADRIVKPGLWVGTGLYLGAALYGLDDDRRKGVPFQGQPRTTYRMIVLDPPREILYDSLNSRVDKMVAAGAIEEAISINKMLETGVIQDSNPVLKAIGLKHLLLHLKGELLLPAAIDLWKRDTRRLAKRQWTWLRKFAAPSSSCIWLQQATSSQAIEFFHKA